MKSSSLLLLVVTLFVIACSTEDPGIAIESHANGRSKAASTDQESVFDLESARRDYQGVQFNVLDISERTKDGQNALAITLSVPVIPTDDFRSHFNVSAKDGIVVDGAWVLSASGKIAWFSNTEPDHDYIVTVYHGLKAANGSVLSATSSQSIKTRNLIPSVNFDTNGLFLTKGLGSGLPVVTVNVNEVSVDFFRIKDNQISHFLRRANSTNRYYWNVEYLTRYGELVYGGRFTLDTPENRRVKRSIDTTEIKALHQPGIYLAVMRVAGQYGKKQLLWFSVTDLGLHARQYEKQLDVHVSSLNSGEPLSLTKVSLLDAKSNVIGQSLTSPQGLASFVGSNDRVKLIVAQTDSEYSVIETKKPALDLSDFDLGKRPQLPVELFIYAPRDLFRPGEVIDFNGLLRDSDGRETTATVLNARIKRPDGSVINTFKLQPQKLGYYYHAWQIPTDAPVGNWELEVTGALKQPVIYAFKVEEFLPERMKLSFNSNAKTPIVAAPGELIKVAVLGEYLYGAPAAGNRLSTIVKVTPWRNPVAGLANYEFGQINETGIVQKFDLKDLRLDKKGGAQIDVASRWGDARSPLRVKLISSLYESGGRPVTRIYSSLVWPKESLIGIRSSFGEKNPEANSRVKFDIVKATLEGELRPANGLEVRLIREDRQYFWVHNDSRGWHYEWTDKEYAEVTQSLDIAAGEAAVLEYPVGYGHYRLEVRDPGNRLTSSIRFYAGYNWYAHWERAQTGSQSARPDKVTIALDRANYQAGDVARVTIVPPQAGQALVMVEGDSPLWMKRLPVPADGVTLEIPISDDWRQHNLYVSAMVLRRGDDQKAITPKRSFGLIHLPLDRDDRKLAVEFDLPEKVLPGQQLDVLMRVSGTDGSATREKLYLTLAAVDVGVLSISNFVTPDPHLGFFGQRRYEVENRDIYQQVIEVSDAQKARLRFGGDADLARGGKEPQSEVQIVSLFSGLVEIHGGMATVPLNIPDFNGRLRLMALAFSVDHFGNGERELIVAAPVVTQIAMPRFLATGDSAILALDINNLSGESQTLDVELTADGPVELQSAPERITLADKEKLTLSYAIEAVGYRGQAQFDLTLSGEGIDAVERSWRLGVRPPYPALVKQKHQLLNTGEQFQLNSSDIQGVLVDTVDAFLSVSSHADMNLDRQLKNLLAYPYGCLEQTSSRAFPLTYATPANQQQFGIKGVSEKKRIEMIEGGIERMASMQLLNGGFGLWSNKSSEEHWLTAFVADFLISAREMGIAVPAVMLDKTMNRLKQYVNRSGRFVDERWSKNSNHYTFSYKAYSAYVLSRVNQAPLGSMRTLFDNQLEWAQSGLSQAQLGIALIKMGDEKRGMAAIDKALQNLPGERTYLGDYGSPIRDKALLMHLLIDNGIYKNRAIEMSYSLAAAIKTRHWFSTQERNAMFLAGISLELNQSGNWRARLMLNAAEQDLEQESNYRLNLDGDAIEAGLLLESFYDKPLFVRVDISGYGKERPEPVADGLSILRSWYTPEGELITPQTVKVGELFVIHLELRAEQRTPDALVVDMIPAGFELENQNLEHAFKLDAFKFDGKSFEQIKRHTAIKHQEYRDDRFVAAVDINRYGSAHLFYLIRAVTPGVYKVPATLVEDMYRPELRGIGETVETITVENVQY